MSLESLKINFNPQNLMFDRIDMEGNNFAAIMKDAAGNEYPYTRDMFFGEDRADPNTLTGDMREAYKYLLQETRQGFEDLLLCHDYARFMHAVELDKGLFSLSFHVHYSVMDHDATNFILTDKEILVITGMLAAPLQDLIKNGPCVIQAATESNLNILKALVNPDLRDRLGVKHRITDKIIQPPRYDLRSI